MRELAIFAGAGGGLLATQSLGFKAVCAVEINQHCQVVLSQRFGVAVYSDVKTFNGAMWRGCIDLVSGGFPCQPFSTASAGKRTAENLWPQMLRIVQEVEPRYVFAENVSIAAIEHAADDLVAVGYQADLMPLAASDVGADHIRERYWLLAYTDDKSQLRGHLNAKMAECEGVCDGVWATSPYESGVVDGVADRMERYRAIGNGQVPLVAATALWSLAFAN